MITVTVCPARRVDASSVERAVEMRMLSPVDADAKPWSAQLRGQRVIVTGGAGFVGSNIVSELVATRANVVVVDDFFTGSRANLPQDSKRVEVIEGSVTDESLMRDVCIGAHTIIHAAARNIIVSTKNPRDDYAVNIGGTLNVLLAAREAEVRRIVYTSSCSIYGNPRHLPINEDETVSLLSPYAVSKFAGESYCHAFYESYDLPTAVVRYSNVYGPGQSPDNPYCGVVAKFFEAAMVDAPPRVHGDGEQTRDYTFVRDVVSATLIAAVSPKAEGKAYNVATGRETSVNELARQIVHLTGSDVDIEHIDRRDIDNIRRRAVSIEKIRRELRWVPSVPLERGLAETYAWLLSRHDS